jgi:hypothetical protein
MIRALLSDRNGVRVATVPTWAAGLAFVGVAALGFLALVIGAGVALLLAPLAIGGIFYARWRLRSALRDMAAQVQAAQVRAAQVRAAQGGQGGPARDFRHPADTDVIEGEYRIIDNGR